MHTAELSRTLLDQIGNSRVRAAVLTSYTLELDFLELEVIPLLLSQDIGYSMDERAKIWQVEEAMRLANLKLEVFCDRPMLMQGEERSPRMEYLLNPVEIPGAAFHPKVVWLLIEDDVHEESETPKRRLLMGVGSNNLTRSGWWENIEVQHWITIESASHSDELLAEVRRDLRFMQSRRTHPLAGTNPGALSHRDAIQPILDYLDQCSPNNESRDLWYRGLSNSQSVPEFIQRCMTNRSVHLLEIISPFFAEDETRDLDRELADYKDAHILLPVESEDTNSTRALCSAALMARLDSRQKIAWSTWADPSFPTKTPQATERTLHAKLFHLQTQHDSWVLTGSVNFTVKAFRNNAEAAFLIRYPELLAPQLKPVSGVLPEPTETMLETPPGWSEETPEESNQSIQINPTVLFDWQARRLTLCISQRPETTETGSPDMPTHWVVRARNNLQQVILEQVVEADTPLHLEATDCEGVETHLIHSGFLFLEITDHHQDDSEPATGSVFQQKVFVQQINWFSKPRNRPRLSPQEILAIYAGLPEQQRQALIEKASLTQLLERNSALEYTQPSDETNPYSEFFCEFAQIFQSFHGLSRNLERYRNNGDWQQLGYYLVGRGIDSVPELINQAMNRKPTDHDAASSEATPVTPVTAYLILLSAKELLLSFRDGLSADTDLQQGVQHHLDALEQDLAQLRQSERIQLKENRNRQHFFDWFEDMFFSTAVTQPAEQPVQNSTTGKSE